MTGALLSGTTGAQTPDTSSRPIKIVVPFSSGGSNDMVGRSIAQQLTICLKRTVVVNAAMPVNTMGELVAY